VKQALIGILMLDTTFPRIPGDIGNAATFPFPVRYRIVKGASPERVVIKADPSLVGPFIEAAVEMEAEGVRAITTSCGFLAIFHEQFVNALRIPMFTSSLLQIPLARAVINKNQKVGIMTARAQSLTERHFAGVGIKDISMPVMGMDEAKEFRSVFFEGKPTMDIEKCRREMVEMALRLVYAHREVGAIVLECTNMPPFSKAIQEAVNLPVFDAVTMVRYAYSVAVQKEYRGSSKGR
jgi:aspartate/glutamate racemase